MTKSMHDEKWVKRWLKRTVSITLGVVVGVLINGGVVFAQDTASLEATVRAQQEQINALIKEVNALKNELSTREQVAAKKVRSVEVTPMGTSAPVTGDDNTPVALSGVDTITGVGPVTVSTNDRNANISLRDKFTKGNIHMDFTNGNMKVEKLTVDGMSINNEGIHLGGKKITNLGAGKQEGDAVNFEQLTKVEKEIKGIKEKTRFQIYAGDNRGEFRVGTDSLIFIPKNGINITGNGSGQVEIGLAKKMPEKLNIQINGSNGQVDLNDGILAFNSGKGIGITGDGNGGMTISSTFEPATRLQIGIDTTGADVDLINGKLDFQSKNGIKMWGNGAGEVNIGLADNIELGKLKLQGPNGIIHLGNDTILESSHFKVGKMDFNGKEDGTGINMYGLPLTGLKDAAVDGDAVNYGQFKIVQEKVKSNETGLNSIKKFDYSGDSGKGTLILGSESSRFNVHGDGSNISTVASDTGVTVNLNQKLSIGGITVDGINNQILVGQDNICLSTNETKLNGVTIGSTEINTGGKKIGGLGRGTNEGDAIVYEQFYAPIRMNITNESKGESSSKNINIHNSGYNYIFSNGLNGEWCGTNTIKIGLGNKVEIKSDPSKGTGNIILEAVGNNSSIKLQDLKISNTGITVPNNSTVKIGDITIDGHSMNFGTQKLTITPDSINVGGGKITNVGAGKVAGDAVNYGQLTGVANKVKSLEESLNASGQLKYTGETGTGEINLRNKKLSLKGDEAITTTASDNGVTVSLKNKFTKGKLSVNSDLGTVQLGGKLPGESKLELSPDSIKAGALEWKDNELKLGNISMKNNNMSIGETQIESNSIQFNEGQIKGLKRPVQKDEAVNLGYLQEKEAAIKGELEKPFILVDSTGKKHELTKETGMKFDNSTPIKLYEENGTYKFDVLGNFEIKNPKGQRVFLFDVESNEPRIVFDNKGLEITPSGMKLGLIEISTNKIVVGPNGIAIDFNSGISLNQKKLTGIPDPENDDDAVNYKTLCESTKTLESHVTAVNTKVDRIKDFNYKTDNNVKMSIDLTKEGSIFGINGDESTIETSSTGKGDVKIGLKDKVVKNNFTLDSNSGTIELKNSSGTAKLTPTFLQFGDVKIEDTGINAGKLAIGEVADGVKPNDAVNKAQLDIVKGIANNAQEFANKGWYYKTDSNKSDVLDEENIIKPGETFNVVGSGAIRTLATKIDDGAEKGKKQLVIEVKKEFEEGKFKVNTEKGEIKINPVSLSENGLIIAHSEGSAYDTVISSKDIKFGGKTVQGVGAGEKDDDAVNVGQLNKQKIFIDNNKTSIDSNKAAINKNKTLIEQNSKLKYEGDTNSGQMPIATGTLAIKGSGGIVTAADNQNKGHITIGLKNKFEVGSLNFDGTDGKIYVGNCNFGVDGLKVGVVELKNESKNATGETVPQILEMHGVKITGLPDGQKDDDAVNYGQLSKVDAKANNALKGWKYKTDTIGTGVDTVIKPEGTFTIKGDGKTIKTSSLNNGTVEVGLKDEFKLNNMSVDTKTATFVFETKDESGTTPKTFKTQLSSKGVDIGNTHLTETGLKVGNIEIAQNGINASGNKITGVADGGEDVTDAVNYGQLKAVKEELETTTGTLNQGWKYAADGTALGSEGVIKPGDTLRINGSEAIKTSIDNGTENSVKIALKDNFTVNNMSVDTKVGELKFNGKETDGKGNVTNFATIVNSKGITAGGVSLTHSGINAGGKKITHLAPGKDDGDAVNMQQWKIIENLVKDNSDKTDDNVVTIDSISKLGFSDGHKSFRMRLDNGTLFIEGADPLGPIVTTATYEENTDKTKPSTGRVKIGIRDKFKVNNMDVDTIGATLVMETEEGSGTAAKTYKTQLSSKGVDIGDTHLTETGLKVGKIQIAQSGINVSGNKITGVAAGGEDVTDAVNYGQLKATEKIATDTQSLLNKGWKYAADTMGTGIDNVIKPDGTFTIKGDGKAIKTSSTENGAVSIGLEKKFNVEKFDVDMDSGTLVLGETGGKTTYGPTGVTAGGVSLTHSGINAGEKKITKVAAGSAADDAVNFSQLEGISEKVEKNKIFKYQSNDGTGQIDLSEGRPLAILGGKAIKTHTETTVNSDGEVNHRLIVELRKEFTTGLMGVDADKGVIAIGKVTQDENGKDIQEDAVIHDGDGIHVGRNISITKENGINAGNKQITKVAAGVLKDDAVNKAQLDEVSTALKETNETVAKGWNYAADDTTSGKEKNIKHGDTLRIKGSDAIETSIDTGTDGSENGVKIALRDKFTVKNMDVDADKGKLILSSTVTDSAGRKDKLSSTFSFKGVEVGDSHLTKDGLSVGNVIVAASGIDAGKHRITQVADGSDEEDAVNKKQLNIVDAKVNKNTTDISNLALNYAGDTEAGKVKLTDTFAVKGDGKNVVTKVPSPNGGIEISLAKDIELGTKVEIKGDTGFYIKDANVSVTDAGFKAGDILMSSTGLTAGGVSVGADGINAGGNKITGVADGGEDVTDAVNYGQLQKVEKDLAETTATLNKGWKYAADGTVLGSEGVIKPGETLSIKGSEAIKTSIDGTEKSVKIALKDKFTVNNMNVDTGKGELTLLSSITDTDGTETNFKSTFSSKGVEVGDSHLTKDGLSVGNVKMTKDAFTAGGVSVSANGIDAGNKKITKVATGTEDKDAVNFGQLTAVEQKADKNTTDISNLAFNYAGNTGTGKVKLTDTFAVKGDGNVVTAVPSSNGGIKISLAKDIKLGTKVEIKGDTGFYIKDAGVVVTEKGFRAGNVVMSSTGLEAGEVSVGANGINAGNKKITGVAAGGKADTDAVNYGQLKAVKEKLETTTGTLNQGWKYAADGTILGNEGVIKPGDTLKIKGSEAIETSIDGTEKSVKIALKDNFKLNKMDVNTNAGSIVLRDERTVAGTEDKEIFETTLNPEGVKVGTLSMTKNGINAGNQKITGVAAGGENTTDAVNYGQLSEVKTMVNDNAGKIAANSKLKYSADIGQNTMNLNDGTLTLKGDVKGIKTHIDNESGNVIIGLKNTVTIGNKLNLDGDAGKISITGSPLSIDGDGLYVDDIGITKDGISVGNKSITLLAGGKADTDAVNVKQLKDIEAKINSTSQEVSQNTRLKFQAGEKCSAIKLATEELKILGGKAIDVDIDKNKSIVLDLKDQFVLGELTVNAKDGILHIGGHDWTLSNQGLNMGKVKVLKAGISAGEEKITDVAAGQAETDAVNMSQLKLVEEKIETTDNRITDIKNNGVVIAGNDNVNITKALGEAVIIRGNDIGQHDAITENYSPENIATYNDGNLLRIAMAKSPKFESINIGGVNLSSNSGGRMTVVNLSDSDQPVELRGIAPGTSEDSVVTKKQFDEAINKNSAAVNNASLKYAGNKPDTVGKSYQMSLKTDTLTIKGNESSKNIVTTTKDSGTIELDLGDTVTIGKPGSEVKIDGTAGTVTTGTTVIAKDNIKTDKVQVGDVTIKDNRISGLADGKKADDAATVGQLNAMKNTVIGDAADVALGKIKVNYEGNSTSKKDVPLTNGEINIVVKGESENRTDGKTNIVSSVKDTGEIDLDLDKKVVIGKGANQITINGDDADSNGGTIKVGITEIKKDGIDVKLESGKKLVVNNKGIDVGKSIITNVADGVNDHDAVNVKQLKELSSMVTSSSTIVKGSGAVIVTPVTEEGHNGYNVHVDKVVQFTDKDGRDVVKVGNNFHVVKNGVVSSTTIAAKDIYTRMVNPDGTTTTPTKLGNVAPGKVAPGSTDAVNGSQLYETQQMIVNNNGLAQQNARQIRELRSDLNNGMAQMAAMSSVEFTGVAPHKMRVAAGIGAYRGSRAVAVGVGYSPQEAFLINAKWSTPTNTCRGSALGIGASYEFNFD